MTRPRDERLERAEAAVDPPVHEGVVIATSHDEAMREIERRIAAGRFDQNYMALIVPPDLTLEEWERRHSAPPPTDDDPPAET